MTLPSKPKRQPRPASVTVRLTSLAADRLKKLALDHNLSQADVVEHLINREWDDYEKALLEKRASKKKKKVPNESP